MNTNIVKSICAAIAATLTTAAFAAAPSSATQFTPKLMNYQGYLANPSTGAAYTDGIYQLECRLYRQASGGTAIWGGRYSVYVKDGYFNLMLGDTSAANLGYTYANNDLWRALWSDTAVAVASRNDLWLGVTPRQGPTGASISSPTEISPRQQLLCGPYAFRAQAAEYANESYTDFKVNGKLTVTGSLAFPNNFSMPWINVTSNATTKAVRLGGTSYSVTTNPSVYSYGNFIGLYSYGNIYLTSYSGDIVATVPSGKSFKITQNNFAVTNSVTSMKSSGVTSITGSSLNLTASSGGAILKSSGSSAYVEAPSGHVYISPATNKYVYGQGHVYWKTPGYTSNLSPFKLKTVKITLSANQMAKSQTISQRGQSDYDHYTWTVAGFDAYQLPVNGNYGIRSCYCRRVTYEGGLDVDEVIVSLSLAYSSSVVVEVQLLGIHNAFLYDVR